MISAETLSSVSLMPSSLPEMFRMNSPSYRFTLLLFLNVCEAVKLAHRFLQSCVQPAFELTGRPFQNLFQRTAFRGFKFSQHMAGNLPRAIPASDPDPQPGKFPRTQMLLDGL